MSEVSVLYVGSIVNDAVEEELDLEHYSLAGNNKKRGVLDSLSAAGADLTVVSPVWINRNSFRLYRGRTVHDEDLGLNLSIPPVLDVFGINYLFLGLATTLLAAKLLLRRDVDVVVFYNFKLRTAVPALCARLAFRTPIVVEYEDGLFLSDITVTRWAAKLLGGVCNPLLGGAICANSALAGRLDTANVAIVRGFPSVGLPGTLPSVESDHEETVVMFAGHFDPLRGIDLFLDAASKLVDRRTDVRFWVAGYGQDWDVKRVRSRIERMDDDRVRYFGTLPEGEYAERLVCADVLVNSQDPSAPISPYTFPSKLLDFMSTGNLVVSTDMADIGEEFGDEILVDGRDAEALANTLSTVLDDGTGQYDEYGRRATSWVTGNCTHERVGENVIGVLDRVTG